DLHVLKGVDLNVDRGEIVSIVGASGAGKTTLLQIIGTLDSHDPNPNSKLLVDKTNIHQLFAKELAAFRNKNIGFILQFHQLLPEFTELENNCIPEFIDNTQKKQAIKREEELLSFLRLSNRKDNK